MLITLNSCCSKRALTETRRILDHFAERGTPRSWQTRITQDGLSALHKALRKTARKNTAVACFLAGNGRPRLLWIVGDRRKFDADGRYPSAIRTRKWAPIENTWIHHQAFIQIVYLAGLLHDIGKASKAFQNMLWSHLRRRNQVRHEWASLRLFEAFVGGDTDEQWLERMSNPSAQDDLRWLRDLKCDYLKGKPFDSPFKSMQNAPLARAVGWLIVSHHRLPTRPSNARDVEGSFDEIVANWNETPNSDPKELAKLIVPYWDFPDGITPITSLEWRQRTARVCTKLLRFTGVDYINNPFFMHVSRLCLMQADHYYSSLSETEVDGGVAYKRDPRRLRGHEGPLAANTVTRVAPDKTVVKQYLPEHLQGVGCNGASIAATLPTLKQALPSLRDCKPLRARFRGKYLWQTRAMDAATLVRDDAIENGAFVVNMASTGCGKTLANAQIINALSDPRKGTRCTFALGLRTLALQTGRSYRKMLGVGADHLAVLVGGVGVSELFEVAEVEKVPLVASNGSESLEPLGDNDSLEYSGVSSSHPVLMRDTKTSRINDLVSAPLLVCTIDHIIPATDSLRGGRQISPMLRLFTSDIVLDEPDDFDIDDLPALVRLVYWAGMLGSRVILSSATLTPSISLGLFQAYRKGRGVFMVNHGKQVMPIVCLWVDEQKTTLVHCSDESSFRAAHLGFAEDRIAFLRQQPQRRMGELIPFRSLDQLPSIITTQGKVLHHRHGMVDPVSGKHVSFGVCRMANIKPLVETAKALWRDGISGDYHLHLCVYHSQFPLAMRSFTERRLERALNRHDPLRVFGLPDIRAALNAHPARNHIFLVLGTPVVETGRDFDFDWAILEPSSMRSLIQGPGRVNRHRQRIPNGTNIFILDTNVRSLESRSPRDPTYRWPGFESRAYPLNSHSMHDLIRKDETQTIDSRPLLLPASSLRPRGRLSDLEHHRLKIAMVDAKGITAATFWQLPPQDTTLVGVLPKMQPFRRKTREETQIRFALDDYGDPRLEEFDIDLKRARAPSPWKSAQKRLHRIIVTPDATVDPWAHTTYVEEISWLAERRGLDPKHCAKKFGHVRIPQTDKGWEWNPLLGFFLETP